jgi:methylated-DNA-[protein]-cysteine S-methyltransferase
MVGTVHAVVESPIGPLTLVGDGTALTAVYMAEHRRRPDATALGERDDAAFGAARTQLTEYFAGGRTQFALELRPVGSPFQLRVWDRLTRIPYGSTRSYAELAGELGDRALAQAVGSANGRNPLSIVVPCHRVVGADGSLTGYAGGLERKRFLLDLEAAVVPGSARLF